MAYIMTLYAVLYPTLIGLCFINLFLYKSDDASLPERLAMGFCMGLMLITFEMFLLSKISVPFSVTSISIPLVPVLLAGVYVTFKNKLVNFDLSGFKNLKLLEILLIALILLKIFLVSSSLMIKPVSGWDAMQIYSFRAKAFFIEKSLNVPMMPATIQGLNNSLNQTWVFVCINEWNDILGKIAFPFYYISLLIMLYFSARRIRPRLSALLATYILASLPFLVYHATIEYCDLMISIYLFAAVSLMFLWLNKPQTRYLILAFVFLLSTILIKKESYFHIAIIIAAFFPMLFSNKFKGIKGIEWIKSFILVFAVLGALFLAWIVLLVPHEGIAFAQSADLSRIPAIIMVFMDYMFARDNWNIIWPLLIILAIFNHKRLKDNFNFFLLFIVLIEVLGFMAYYFFSKDDIYGWLFFVTPAVRNTLQFIPVVVLLISSLLIIENNKISPAKQLEQTLRRKNK
jgi:hypothetical protein